MLESLSGHDVRGKRVARRVFRQHINKFYKTYRSFQLISRLINANDIPRADESSPLSSRRLHN